MHLIHYNIGTTNAHGSALNKTNDTLYVTSQSGNFIYKVDTGFTMIPIQITLDMSGTPSNTPGTFDPHEILFSADGSKYFVTCEAANQVRLSKNYMSHVKMNQIQPILRKKVVLQ